ncbi:hypothetical protein DFH07DRAFT_781960 [Mycena maculata]|uniref:Uncharacterized protein n=1 Tax=Mycena maculata TaxID=230809 RepID=A0AAD7HXA7_9AGAR|nr:hypothetical protein DFH07DRAFT_781960 [Mycena maculata]
MFGGGVGYASATSSQARTVACISHRAPARHRKARRGKIGMVVTHASQMYLPSVFRISVPKEVMALLLKASADEVALSTLSVHVVEHCGVLAYLVDGLAAKDEEQTERKMKVEETVGILNAADAKFRTPSGAACCVQPGLIGEDAVQKLGALVEVWAPPPSTEDGDRVAGS